MLGPVMIENAFALLLQVNLTDKPFEHRRVWVEATGPFGYKESNWYTWTDINTSPTSASVSMNLPDSEFPSNSQLKVCASSNELLAFVAPNCRMFENSGGSQSVTISLR